MSVLIYCSLCKERTVELCRYSAQHVLFYESDHNENKNCYLCKMQLSSEQELILHRKYLHSYSATCECNLKFNTKFEMFLHQTDLAKTCTNYICEVPFKGFPENEEQEGENPKDEEDEELVGTELKKQPSKNKQDLTDEVEFHGNFCKNELQEDLLDNDEDLYNPFEGNTEDLINEKIQNSTRNSFHCNECGIDLSNSRCLYYHNSNYHRKGGTSSKQRKTQFPCACDSIFGTLLDLVSHKKSCPHITKCKTCGKRYRHFSSLMSHIKKNHPKRPKVLNKN